MGFRIVCPHCGSRPSTDFWFRGEDRPVPPIGPEDPEHNFQRVWLRDNVAGVQTEVLFHHAGCRRWFKVQRNTLTNEIHGYP